MLLRKRRKSTVASMKTVRLSSGCYVSAYNKASHGSSSSYTITRGLPVPSNICMAALFSSSAFRLTKNKCGSPLSSITKNPLYLRG